MVEFVSNDEIDLSKNVFIITDGNHCGIELASFLSNKGAAVILGVEDIIKKQRIAERFTSNSLGAVIPMELNLKSLKQIKSFAELIQKRFPSVTAIIHNADIKMSSAPQTDDGIESFFGINYLSHFALTSLLIKQLSYDARIITVTPIVKPKEKVVFRHFHHPKNKKQKELYVQSKLACMFFAKRLDEQLRKYKKSTSSILCYVKNEEQKLKNRKKSISNGMLPIIYCATSENIKSGDEIGMNVKGHNAVCTKLSIVNDFYHPFVAENLWKISESLTGIPFRLK